MCLFEWFFLLQIRVHYCISVVVVEYEGALYKAEVEVVVVEINSVNLQCFTICHIVLGPTLSMIIMAAFLSVV